MTTQTQASTLGTALGQEATQFCTFHVEDLYFGVDVQEVQEVIRYHEMTRVPLAADAVKGLINLRGQIVPAIDMRRQLDLPDRDAEQLPMNVVVRTDDGPVSLLVDEIGDVVEVDPETYEPRPETVRGAARRLVNSVYKLPDRLLLVLDTQCAVSVDGSERESG
jgi:purine-binding chemotaxis protein CheW